MPLRRGTRFPRGWGQWGGPWLPAHYPVLVLKENSTASSRCAWAHDWARRWSANPHGKRGFSRCGASPTVRPV